MLACRLCDWHLLCTAQHYITPLGIPQPSCSASPAALWVVQLELGEGWLSGESHFGPKPRCGYVLLCTAAGQKTDWEAWLSTSAPETLPSARDPVGQGGVRGVWGGKSLLSHLKQRNQKQEAIGFATFLCAITGSSDKPHSCSSGLVRKTDARYTARSVIFPSPVFHLFFFNWCINKMRLNYVKRNISFWMACMLK